MDHDLLPFVTVSDDVPVDALLGGLSQHVNVAYGAATEPAGGTYELLVVVQGKSIQSEMTFMFFEETNQVIV